MARWTPHAERQVPRLSPQDRRELLRAATSWRLKRQDVTEPPWVLAHPYSDVDDDAVLAAVFAADSRRVLTGGRDGTVRTYRCELCGGIAELRSLAQSRLSRIRRTAAG